MTGLKQEGVNDPCPARTMIQFAGDLLDKVAEKSMRLQMSKSFELDEGNKEEFVLQCRIGIATGPVCSGVLGLFRKKYSECCRWSVVSCRNLLLTNATQQLTTTLSPSLLLQL